MQGEKNRGEERQYEQNAAKPMQDVVAVIIYTQKIGGLIASKHPEIAGDYRSGSTLREIVKKYELMEEYDIRTDDCARSAVHVALSKLIPEEECTELKKAHLRQRGYNAGTKSYEQGIGIHAMTREQRAEVGRKGGAIAGRKTVELRLGLYAMTKEQQLEASSKGGKTSYEHGTGMHSLTSEQKAAAGRKGGKKGGIASALARGSDLWSGDESKHFCELCQNPEYQHARGSHKGKPDYEKIVRELSVVFGTNRTPRTLTNYSYEMRKSGMTEANES